GVVARVEPQPVAGGVVDVGPVLHGRRTVPWSCVRGNIAGPHCGGWMRDAMAAAPSGVSARTSVVSDSMLAYSCACPIGRSAMYTQGLNVKDTGQPAAAEDPDKLARFQAKIDAEEKIEANDWMPEAYRRTLVRQISQHAHSEI